MALIARFVVRSGRNCLCRPNEREHGKYERAGLGDPAVPVFPLGRLVLLHRDRGGDGAALHPGADPRHHRVGRPVGVPAGAGAEAAAAFGRGRRSEEHTSELQSLMRISYAVFCLKKKNHITYTHTTHLYMKTTNKI